MKVILASPLSLGAFQVACAIHATKATASLNFGKCTSPTGVVLDVNSNKFEQPGAICRLLAGPVSKSIATAALVDELLDLSNALGCAVDTQDTKATGTALKAIDAILGKNTYLTGKALTVADAVIFACMYPSQGSHHRPANLKKWFERISKEAFVGAALKAVKITKPSDLKLKAPAKAATAVKVVKVAEQKSAPKAAAPKAAAAPAQSGRRRVIDTAWAPSLPPGHSVYSWRSAVKQKPALGPTVVQEDGRPVILPTKGRKNVLITSALPYVNNVPHLGNIIGCVLSADVYARFCRLRGYNSIYVCGTDEYGTATETKAIQAGLTPQQICDKFHKIHKEIYEWFDIKFDQFGRTTTKQQTVIAQDIFKKCQAAGRIKQKEVKQLWCEKFGFLADRFVEGTCPKCKYDDARGDQCDACGTLLNATELLNPKAKLDPSVPVLEKVSTHLFLDLPGLTPALKEFIRESSVKGQWTENSKQVTNGWVRDGLKDRCITRDLKWGTPVPAVGFEDKVFYVWFDAPIGYLSITANYTKDWEKWWKNPEDVELVQFMGKDNIPFHTVIFPCSLLGSGDPYTMLHHISTTEYLNFEGGKFSKSRGVGVFGNDAQATEIPSEVWRYYLLSNRPESSDSMFTWDDFAAKNNNELLANLGNFVHRILSFLFTKFDATVPAFSTTDDAAKIKEMNNIVSEYVEVLDGYKLRAGLNLAMKLSKLGNQFMQDNAPWVLLKKDKARCSTVMGVCVNLVYMISVLIEPYMPSVSKKICEMLNVSQDPYALATGSIGFRIQAGHSISPCQVLFRKILPEEVEDLRARFSGSQDERGAGPKMPVDLAVGTIVTVKAHPDSDTLYVLGVDLGEGQPRTICSGLRKKCTAEELQGKQVVVLLNGIPTDFLGVVSDGMILTADKKKGFALLTVEKPVANGTKVLPKGGTAEPEPNYDIRNKFKKLEFKTDKKGHVLFMDQPCLADGSVVLGPGVTNAKIR